MGKTLVSERVTWYLIISQKKKGAFAKCQGQLKKEKRKEITRKKGLTILSKPRLVRMNRW